MEKIGDYHFDFEEETSRLLDGLGPAAARTVFLEVRLADRQVFPLQGAGDPTVIEDNFDRLMNIEAAHFATHPGGGSHAGNLEGRDNPVDHIVTLVENDAFFSSCGPENEQLLRLFTLYHEFGHTLLTEGPAADKTHTYEESAADAFAALCFLRRFGKEAAPLLSVVGWLRALHAVTGGTAHLTTTVLDKIIADADALDIGGLSLKEIAATAHDYATDWAPDEARLKRAIPHFVQSNNAALSVLEETALASSDTFAFYIGAKVFQPFLHPQGAVIDGRTLQLSAEARARVARMIQDNMPDSGLSCIFERAAVKGEPPLSTTVQVSRPKGQKPFVVKL